MIKHIPVSEPNIGEREKELVMDAIKKGDISGTHGEYIKKFERLKTIIKEGNKIVGICASRWENTNPDIYYNFIDLLKKYNKNPC